MASMTLPFKISAQPKDMQKAYKNFKKQYGKDADRIFLAYADEHGTGSTQRLRARSVFKKGAKIAE
jgi:hypothetical protein